MSMTSGSSAPSATARKSSPALWKTFQTANTDPPAYQSNTVVSSRGRHENRAAVVARREARFGVVADPVGLDRGDRQPTSLTRAPDQHRDARAVILRADTFEVGDEIGTDRVRRFRAGRRFDRDLGVDLGFGRLQRLLQ